MLAWAVTSSGHAHAGTHDARAVYLRALDRLNSAAGFRLVETLDVRAGEPRRVLTEIRYRSPGSLQTTVKNVLPAPPLKLTITQIGQLQCQTPPGVCWRVPTEPTAADSVHKTLGPTMAVNYRLRPASSGDLEVRLTRSLTQGARYEASLTISGHSGLPLAFSSRVEQGRRTLVTQVATFRYGPVTVSMPPGTRIPKGK
jgi:hypothetical protein